MFPINRHEYHIFFKYWGKSCKTIRLLMHLLNQMIIQLGVFQFLGSMFCFCQSSREVVTPMTTSPGWCFVFSS